MNKSEHDNAQLGIENDDLESQERIDEVAAAELERERESEAERAALLERRRARQTGKSFAGVSTRKKVTALLFAGTALAMFYVGYSVLNAKEDTKEAAVPASKVSLEVEKEKTQSEFRIDLSSLEIPSPEVAKKPEFDKNQLDHQLTAMKVELETIKQAAKEDADKAIDKMNKEFERRLADERRKLQEEQRREKVELQRLQAEAKLAADVARQEEEFERQLQEITKKQEDLKIKQLESKSLVLDGSQEGVALGESNDGGGAINGVSGGNGGGAGGNASSGGKNEQFLAANANSTYVTTYAKSLGNPSKTIVQGTIISAVLETAIDTQLPGNIRAQVIEPVFSFDGSHILMPAGTMLIGTFNTDIVFEQKRVLIAWNRAITPDGDSIAIGGTGADLLGRSGTAGNVDNRYFKKFGAATLMSAISIAPAILSAKLAPPEQKSSSSGEPSVSLNVGGGANGKAGGDLFGNFASGVGDPASDTLKQYLDLPPIIRVAQGEEIRVFVNRDLIFR
jgi:type IV secretion system protein VirB10